MRLESQPNGAVTGIVVHSDYIARAVQVVASRSTQSADEKEHWQSQGLAALIGAASSVFLFL
jgi:hypothetical protein